MSDAVDEVLDAVRASLEPGPAERRDLEAALADLIRLAEEAIDEADYDADVMHVGSTARDTWLSGERDIDIFIRFDPAIDRVALEERGLAIGRTVLPNGRANYAEHPYITGSYDGFDVDIVPCIAVDDATDARTAVDRTPFHTAYVSERLTEESPAEVRLAKRFLSTFGAYGSNLRTRGFGGYLLELLIFEYGTFRSLLEAVASWEPPVRIDPEDHAETSFDDDLVVIDPTDPNRNVAAVVSLSNLARFQHYARTFLDEPNLTAFEKREPPPFSPTRVEVEIEQRGTTLLGVRFDRPEIVDDQLYPQLRKSRVNLVDALDRRGFSILRSTSFVGDSTVVVLFECAVADLPAVERHVGPPLAMEEHAKRFFESYEDDDAVYGPFVEGGRYVVERPRDFQSARAFLESEAIFTVGLGDHVRGSMRSGYEVLSQADFRNLANEFPNDFGAYFSPIP